MQGTPVVTPEPTSQVIEQDVAIPAASLVVETHRLRKVFGRFVAVADLTIAVERGQVFGFLGPNGAGKTTSIKMLMGLTHPTSGSARLLGKPLGNREAKRHIGFLPELFRFQDWLTGEEVLDFHGKLYGMSAAKRKRRIPEVLETVGLLHRRNEQLHSYSKGMQQRIGLAQALLNDPQLIFLDEPTSALDPLGRQDVRNIIRDLRAQGKTVFLNSHLLSEVEAVCDRVAIINRGQIEATGPMAELLNRELVIELRLGSYDDGIRAMLEEDGIIHEVRCVEGRPSVVALEVANEEVVARLIDRLVQRGVAVYGATPHHLTLEELFFEVVAPSSGRRDG
jgi:ABC-2 type transport system ATP-binding protein